MPLLKCLLFEYKLSVYLMRFSWWWCFQGRSRIKNKYCFCVFLRFQSIHYHFRNGLPLVRTLSEINLV
jgi:hypothetical protein